MTSWTKSIVESAVRTAGTTVVSKVVKYSFWTALALAGPQAVVSTIGITGLAAAGLIAHSGLIEYAADKVIASRFTTDENQNK